MPFVTVSALGLLAKDKGQSTTSASGPGTWYDPKRYEQETGEAQETLVPAQPGEPGAFLNPVSKRWEKKGVTYSSAGKNVSYHRNMAEEAQKREGVKIDYAQANQSRDAQLHGMGLMRDAAMGNAPSRAELLGRSMADDAARNQIAMAGMAGAGPAGALAARTGMGQAADLQRRVGVDMAGLRADEMARAREGYFGASMGMGAQDAARAQAQAALEAEQRRINDAYAMGQHTLGADFIKLAAQQNMHQQGTTIGAHTSADAANVNKGIYNSGQEWGAIDRFVGAGQGAIGMGMGAATGGRGGGR